MNKRIALLDADMFVYKVGCAAQKEIMFDEYVMSIGDKPEAIIALDNWVSSIVSKVHADSVELAFTGKENFRKQIFPEYKENRKKNKMPMLVKELRDYCLRNYKCHLVEPLEADDILGIAGTGPNRGDYILVSFDKDMLTIPGMHFNPDKDLTIQIVDLEEATTKFFVQTLMGDATDNYKGAPGIGEVKAYKYINRAKEEATENGVLNYQDFVDLGWNAVVKCFDGDEGEAIIQASMAKILWYGEFDKDSKAILEFTPQNLINYKNWRQTYNGS